MALDEPPHGRAMAQEEELGMTKQKKVLPARRQRDQPQNGDSILLRSAESIGRVIGSLQRQLDNARTRLSGPDAKDRDAAARSSQNGRAKSTSKTGAKVKRAASVARANGTVKAKSSAVNRKPTTSSPARKKRARKSR